MNWPPAARKVGTLPNPAGRKQVTFFYCALYSRTGDWTKAFLFYLHSLSDPGQAWPGNGSEQALESEQIALRK